MPPRANPTIDLMISQAKRKLTEIKELQYFGGDSLNLKRWSQIVNVAGDSVQHCWRLRITPTDPETMMPLSVQVKPHTADYMQVISAYIEAVHRDDDIFEYLIIPPYANTGATRSFKLQVEYSGAASFSLVQIA